MDAEKLKKEKLKKAREAYTKAYDDIVDAITNPDAFASALFSAELISKDNRDAAMNERGATPYNRAVQLASAAETMVRLDTDSFSKFLTELRKTSPAGKVIADRIANGECKQNFSMISRRQQPLNA